MLQRQNDVECLLGRSCVLLKFVLPTHLYQVLASNANAIEPPPGKRQRQQQQRHQQLQFEAQQRRQQQQQIQLEKRQWQQQQRQKQKPKNRYILKQHLLQKEQLQHTAYQPPTEQEHIQQLQQKQPLQHLEYQLARLPPPTEQQQQKPPRKKQKREDDLFLMNPMECKELLKDVRDTFEKNRKATAHLEPSSPPKQEHQQQDTPTTDTTTTAAVQPETVLFGNCTAYHYGEKQQHQPNAMPTTPDTPQTPVIISVVTASSTATSTKPTYDFVDIYIKQPTMKLPLQPTTRKLPTLLPKGEKQLLPPKQQYFTFAPKGDGNIGNTVFPQPVPTHSLSLASQGDSPVFKQPILTQHHQPQQFILVPKPPSPPPPLPPQAIPSSPPRKKTRINLRLPKRSVFKPQKEQDVETIGKLGSNLGQNNKTLNKLDSLIERIKGS